MKRLLLLLPVFLIVLTSGCIMPEGLNIPFFSSGPTYESDVLIVKDLSAIPSTVRAGENVRVIAYIENLGKDAVPQKSITTDATLQNHGVVVRLYDHCEGLFTSVTPTCTGGSSTGKGCKFDKILAGETVVVDWTLKSASGLKLATPCDLKVYVQYPYTTDGLTTISFIGQNEYKRQLEAGTFKSTGHYTAKGQGPVKTFFTVNDQEPIPAASAGTTSYTSASLDFQNMGYGFLADPTSTVPKTPGARIINESFKLIIPNALTPDTKNCELKEDAAAAAVSGAKTYIPKTDVKLIKNKRSLPCNLKIAPDSANMKETSFQLKAQASYLYEFRKSARVTVNPLV